MKVKILGSAAAEAVPALWCECEVCARAVRRGGREIRRRTAYAIDGDTLVDFGPDAYWQSVEFHLDLTAIRRLLVTHAHSDHLNPVDLAWRYREVFSKVTHRLRLFGTRPTAEKIDRDLRADGEKGLAFLQIDFVELAAGKKAADGDLEIFPVRANHAPQLEPLNYLLRRGGRTLLVANDTGFWTDEAFAQAEAFGVCCDAAILDSTMGLHRYLDHRDGHMGGNTVVAFRDELVRRGLLAPDARVVANHFSHNGGANHDDYCAFYTPHGIETGFDGLEFEV